MENWMTRELRKVDNERKGMIESIFTDTLESIQRQIIENARADSNNIGYGTVSVPIFYTRYPMYGEIIPFITERVIGVLRSSGVPAWTDPQQPGIIVVVWKRSEW